MRIDQVPETYLHVENPDAAGAFYVRVLGGGHSIDSRDPAGNSLELATPQTWGSILHIHKLHLTRYR